MRASSSASSRADTDSPNASVRASHPYFVVDTERAASAAVAMVQEVFCGQNTVRWKNHVERVRIFCSRRKKTMATARRLRVPLGTNDALKDTESDAISALWDKKFQWRSNPK